jgi:hypothetical protein
VTILILGTRESRRAGHSFTVTASVKDGATLNLMHNGLGLEPASKCGPSNWI